MKLDKLFRRFGYMPEREHNKAFSNYRQSHREEVAAIRSQNIGRLVEAIRTVDMVKARYDTPSYMWTASDGQIDQKASISFDTIQPPEPNWYQIGVRIDVGKLQRIYDELHMAGNSYEYEYLIDSLCHEVRQNIGVLMRVKG